MSYLLNDDQVHDFIANGFLRLEPDVAEALHNNIARDIEFAIEKENGSYGNNIVSRVPALWDIIRSRRIDGALKSLLGPNYYVHPHRAIHINRPVEDKTTIYPDDFDGPPMGKGSMAGSGWHQDAQSPLSRARHHLPKFLIGFYFPHDAPPEMGPTRIQAGSHLFAHPVEPSGVLAPKDVKAGTFFLVHFDMVHAGFTNRTELTRYMVKFVFTRVESPTEPSWNCKNRNWQKPKKTIIDYNAEPAWKYIWNWMLGSPAINQEGADLMALNSLNQPERLESIYLCNTDQINVLAEQISALAGSGNHNRLLAKDADGNTIPRDDSRGYPRRWNERAIVYDDAAYALAAIGEAAIPALLKLTDEEDPWVIMNATFALGEIGQPSDGVETALVHLLDHPLQQVVRQTLDSLALMNCDLELALPKIEHLLTHTNPEWQTKEVQRGWTGEDQVRLNAVFTLLSAVEGPTNNMAIEDILTQILNDRNGYVPAVATEALARIGSVSASQTALRYLQERRLDDALRSWEKPF